MSQEKIYFSTKSNDVIHVFTLRISSKNESQQKTLEKKQKIEKLENRIEKLKKKDW